MSGYSHDSLRTAGNKIAEIYEAYGNLRALVSQLQGLPDSAPLPAAITIDKILIAYTVNGVGHAAEVRTVRRVGDIARLLQLETDALVNQLRDQAARARQFVDALEDMCNQATYVVNAQRRGSLV